MDLMEAMKARHSVRQYLLTPLTQEAIAAMEEEIAACNREGGLHIQLVTDEPRAFSGGLAHYGSFRGVSSYLVLVGAKAPDLEERCGYYGERLVLRAQQLGLNTCWVALTYRKIPNAFQVSPGEKLTVVISLGYGETQGVPHRSKSLSTVASYDGEMPEWFLRGAEAALLAPTAVNQQKFRFYGAGDQVRAKAGFGTCTKIDLGIAKYHFELGAGTENFSWA